MRVYISRTGRPDTDYLANELKYVSQYALHKAKDLEEALWSVAGVGDMVDITDETLNHLDLPTELIEQMNKRKQIWFKTAQLITLLLEIVNKYNSCNNEPWQMAAWACSNHFSFTVYRNTESCRRHHG